MLIRVACTCYSLADLVGTEMRASLGQRAEQQIYNLLVLFCFIGYLLWINDGHVIALRRLALALTVAQMPCKSEGEFPEFCATTSVFNENLCNDQCLQ